MHRDRSALAIQALALCSGEQNPEDPHVRLRDSEDLKVQAVKDAILLKCKDIFSQWSYYTDIQDMAEELTGQVCSISLYHSHRGCMVQVRKEVGAALNRQLPVCFWVEGNVQLQ